MERKLTILEETKLWQYLKNISLEYANNALLFVSEIDPILEAIENYFPHYTKHNFDHGIEVVRRITDIIHADKLDENSGRQLSAAEAYLLICASFSHDLGMAILPHEVDLIQEFECVNNKNDMLVIQEKLRKTHSIRGGEYIEKKHTDLKIPHSFVSYLDILMKSHNLSKSDFRKLSKRSIAGKNIDLKKLALLLCVADLLEFSNNRVFLNVLDELEGTVEYDELFSYIENLKHDIIGGNITIHEKYIQLSGDFKNPKVLDRVHKTVDEIQMWLDFYVSIDLENEETPYLKFGMTKIISDLKPIGFEYERSAIHIGKDEVIRLITSRNIWGVDYELPLRELLQNSVEACRFRVSRSRISDCYRPFINIEYNRDLKELRILDNGCGMTKDVILNNFLTMANSRSRNPEYTKNHNPISRFGLGFWSVFIISNEVSIVTKAMEDYHSDYGYEFNVNVDELTDYTILTHKTCKVGTQIILKLKDDFANSITNIVSSIKNVMICSEVDIIIKSDNKVYSIKNELPQVDIFGLISKSHRDYYNFCDYIKNNEIKMKFYSGTVNSEIDYVIGFPYKMQNQSISYLCDDGTYIFNHSSLSSITRKAVCGFVVRGIYSNKVNTLNFRPDYSLFNIRNPKGFEYEIRRKELVKNDVSYKWGDKIRLIEIDKKREFLKDFGVYNNEHIYEFTEIQLLTSAYKHNYDIYGEGVKDVLDLISFRLFDFVKDDNQYKFLGYRYLNLKELLEVNDLVYFINVFIKDMFINYTYPNSYIDVKPELQRYHPVNSLQKQIFGELLMQLMNKKGLNNVTLIDPDSRAFKLFLGDKDSALFLACEHNTNVEAKYKGQFHFHEFIPSRVNKESFENTFLYGNRSPSSNQPFVAWKINLKDIKNEYIFKSDRELYVKKESKTADIIHKCSSILPNKEFLMAMSYLKAYGIDKFMERYKY